ncbi:hypothetical protein J41TS2_31040 [Bacillus sonorensis]|nr:hypothetical protein J41TS2_31040 [Bacillus sonorensis]
MCTMTRLLVAVGSFLFYAFLKEEIHVLLMENGISNVIITHIFLNGTIQKLRKCHSVFLVDQNPRK